MSISEQKTKSKSAVGLFFSGVFVLTLANVLVKAVGLISKIILNRVVGSVGAGYYSSAYEIYAYLYVISTSGLPVALSIMISKCRAKGKYKEAKRIYDLALALFLVIGITFSLLMIAFADKIALMIGARETRLCIVAIAPTMLFICISSCLRGYFQGFQLMHPTAISQIIEAISKVAVGVMLALFAKSKGYPDYVVAACTVFGVTLGVFLGMIYLYVKKLKFNEEKYFFCVSEENNEDKKALIKELFKIAVPITLSSSVLSLTTVIDTLMVQNRLLAYGMNDLSIKIYYGDYTSLVISMFNLPTILFYPIVNALVPLISATKEKGDEAKNEAIRCQSLRIVTLISVPCAVGLGFFSYPILDLLMFKSDSVKRASPWLSIVAVSVIFLGIIATTNAFLNTSGKQKLPVISMGVGALGKLLSNYLLLGKIGIWGAPISTVICYILAAALNVLFVVKYVGKLPPINKIFTVPIFNAIFSIGLSAVIYLGLTHVIAAKLATVIAIFIAVLLYALLSLKFKVITEDDILMLPKGNKILKLLYKYNIITRNRTKCIKK